MVSHPEVMRTLLSSPFVQQMMSSPDLMRQLMSTNPQLCEVMEVTDDHNSSFLAVYFCDKLAEYSIEIQSYNERVCVCVCVIDKQVTIMLF